MKHMWSEEEIQAFKKDISNLVDSKGNPRFVEGDGVGLTQEGVTILYCKWGLAGTHLMFVVAGSVANGTKILNSVNWATFNIPKFIKDKIYPVWANNYIERKLVVLFADNWTSQNATAVLAKGDNISIQTSGDITLTADRSFRIQFDLLIDSE